MIPCFEPVFVESNAFNWPFGAGAAAEVDALFAFTSLTNHSCEPSVSLHPRLPPGESGAAGDAQLVCIALRDLAPGDELTHNYGPDALLAWPREERLRFMEHNHGFRCACARCAREDGMTAMEDAQRRTSCSRTGA